MASSLSQEQIEAVEEICRYEFGRIASVHGYFREKTLDSVLKKMRNGDYSSLDEVVNDVLTILDEYIVVNNATFSYDFETWNEELAVVIEFLKKKFIELKDKFAENSRIERFLLESPFDGKMLMLNDPNILHYYIATSQYYKMVLYKVPDYLAPKETFPLSNRIESIEYIVNKKMVAKFEARKKIGGENEILLFHGTDEGNVENIFRINFDINWDPKHKFKTKKFGPGVYLSEHPLVCANYGSALILCKVLPGRVYKIESFRHIHDIPEGFDSLEVVEDGIAVIYVVKSPDQILPYCVINRSPQPEMPSDDNQLHVTTPLQNPVQYSPLFNPNAYASLSQFTWPLPQNNLQQPANQLYSTLAQSSHFQSYTTPLQQNPLLPLPSQIAQNGNQNLFVPTNPVPVLPTIASNHLQNPPVYSQPNNPGQQTLPNNQIPTNQLPTLLWNPTNIPTTKENK